MFSIKILDETSSMCCVHNVYSSSFAIVSKMETEEQQRRNIILRTYLENPDLVHRAIGRKMGIAQSTVPRVLNRYNECLTVDRKEKSDQNGSPYSEKDHKRVVQAFKRNPNSSVRDTRCEKTYKTTHVQSSKGTESQ